MCLGELGTKMGKCTLCGERHYYFRNPNPKYCQRHKDIRFSAKVLKAHQPFKYCKHWQRCSTCSSIKEHVQRLKHMAGLCGEYNKKCNICNLLKSPDERSISVGASMGTKNIKTMQKIIKDIYRMQFKAPIGVRWKYR